LESATFVSGIAEAAGQYWAAPAANALPLTVSLLRQ